MSSPTSNSLAYVSHRYFSKIDMSSSHKLELKLESVEKNLFFFFKKYWIFKSFSYFYNSDVHAILGVFNIASLGFKQFLRFYSLSFSEEHVFILF